MMWNRLNSTMPKNLEESLHRKPIEFQNSLDEISILLKDLCFHCGGSGKLNAMQSMAVIGGGSVRGPDTTTKCNLCNGTGRI